jgi:putative transposase
LLPDHLHCIWTLPETDADFAKRWGMIKRHVSQHCAHLIKGDELPSASKRSASATKQTSGNAATGNIKFAMS